MKTPSEPLRRLTGSDLAFALQQVFMRTKGRTRQDARNVNSVLHQIAAEALGRAMEEQGLMVVHATTKAYAAQNPDEVVQVATEGDRPADDDRQR